MYWTYPFTLFDVSFYGCAENILTCDTVAMYFRSVVVVTLSGASRPAAATADLRQS